MSPPSFVETRGAPELDLDYLSSVAIGALQLARRIGIRAPDENRDRALPYSPDSDQVVFKAPHLSDLVGKEVAFLRGWSSFESCIKGYNALGLMAEQVLRHHRALRSSDATSTSVVFREFLRTRRVNGKTCFAESEVAALTDSQVLSLDLQDVAIWQALARVPIVCSTSSNMGISLHDALRALQRAPVRFMDRQFTILNEDEGSLTIWCPDERADFMNAEKSEYLRRLEAQAPPLTRLRTYINRQERDPGALSDALNCGGYFFPTNPQSPDELQNLLYYALLSMSESTGTPVPGLLDDKSVRETLCSLGCEVADFRVVVRQGVEGGLGGLMLPYFLLAEEMSTEGGCGALSVWNQASIGAALASAVLADEALRSDARLSDSTRYLLDAYFPNARKRFTFRRARVNTETSIHGVFDLANIQSLAQLLGVVVGEHLSGKGTAYVGLGSASYSNGNRCFEVLDRDGARGGPFRGKNNFHPATHTLNPVAAALVYGEEVARVSRQFGNEGNGLSEVTLRVQAHCRKPEPAGAASVAGYLLTRLDRQSLSSVQVATTLRLLGFDRDLFLGFSGYPPGRDGEQAYVRAAQEEGPRMRALAVELMTFLQWPFDMLKNRAQHEAVMSGNHDFLDPIDPPSLEILSPLIVLYLTGDNTGQPSEELIRRLVENQMLHGDVRSRPEQRRQNSHGAAIGRLRRLDLAMRRIGQSLSYLERSFQSLRQSTLRRLVEKTTR